jgi:uncharacterized protein YcaQ
LNYSLSKQQARRFLVAYHGLDRDRYLGKSGAMDYIRRVGCIQFDPLNIVGRNAQLVLQSRVADFKPAMLAELLYQDRLLVDGWDKVMSIYPVEDWPYFKRNRDRAFAHLGSPSRPTAAILPQVRDALKERGPLSSIDLEFDDKVRWPWGATRASRAALESMYSWGELIIHHKVNTRKVYDFAKDHLPAEILSAPEPNPAEADFHDWYLLRRIGAIGLLWNKAGDAWVGMDGIKSKERTAAIARLIDQTLLQVIEVQGLNQPIYMPTRDQAIMEQVLDEYQPDGVQKAAIIAPLDNLIWDRRLIEAVFDFDYRWEVYKPVNERQYGYYVLPILYGDRFIARFEPGRDKKKGALTIKNWWWEDDVQQTPEMRNAIRACFNRFLGYLGADQLVLSPQAVETANLNWLRM